MLSSCSGWKGPVRGRVFAGALCAVPLGPERSFRGRDTAGSPQPGPAAPAPKRRRCPAPAPQQGAALLRSQRGQRRPAAGSGSRGPQPGPARGEGRARGAAISPCGPAGQGPAKSLHGALNEKLLVCGGQSLFYSSVLLSMRRIRVLHFRCFP